MGLSVCDNGIGFPEGFDWKKAQTLGLQLVRMLAGQLDGTVDVTSGGGTEFEIRFPFSAP